MNLVAFRDLAWAKMVGGLLGGEVEYAYTCEDTIKFVAELHPEIVFLSSYLAEPRVIELIRGMSQARVVYICRCLTRQRRQQALNAGAYEVLDVFSDEWPAVVLDIVELANEKRRSVTSSPPARALRLLP